MPSAAAPRAESFVLPPLADRARRQDAVGLNAAIPFEQGLLGKAAVYRFAGDADDRDRALDCLAAAALYEAGGDAEGQRAVIQVALNRARHPAYPGSICAVVFQGAERASGCQFTFTCDGSLRRRYSEAAWASARSRAKSALDGYVHRPVGLATHYHTDWVHPPWSAQLAKVARVGDHLFLRWRGGWGSAAAFRRYGSAAEGGIPQLGFRPAHQAMLALDPQMASRSVQPDAVPGGVPGATPAIALRVTHPQGGAFLLQVRRDQPASALTRAALRYCGQDDFCHVMAWSDAGFVPKGFPINPQQRARVVFEYLRDRQLREERVRFDCRAWPRPQSEQCFG